MFEQTNALQIVSKAMIGGALAADQIVILVLLAASKSIDCTHTFATSGDAASGEPRGRAPHPATDLDDGSRTFGVARKPEQQIAFMVAEPALDVPEAHRESDHFVNRVKLDA